MLGVAGRGDLQPQLDSAMQDVNDMYLLMEETEKQAVRRALVEERGRYCTFISFLQPVVVRSGRYSPALVVASSISCAGNHDTHTHTHKLFAP